MLRGGLTFVSFIVFTFSLPKIQGGRGSENIFLLFFLRFFVLKLKFLQGAVRNGG